MMSNELTAADLTELEPGDELTVEYESPHGDRGNTQTLTATVHSTDTNHMDGYAFGTIELKRESDGIPRRRLKLTADSITVQNRNTTINGAVWSRMSTPTSVTVTTNVTATDGGEDGEVECSRCNGRGERGPDIINPDECTECDGTGTVPAQDAWDTEGEPVSEGDEVTARHGSMTYRVAEVHADGRVTLTDGRSMSSDHLRVSSEDTDTEGGDSHRAESDSDGTRRCDECGRQVAAYAPADHAPDCSRAPGGEACRREFGDSQELATDGGEDVSDSGEGGEDHVEREQRNSAGKAFRAAAERHAEAVNRGEKTPGGSATTPDDADDSEDAGADAEDRPDVGECANPHELSEGDRVTVDATRLPIQTAEQYPREITGEIVDVDRVETGKFREVGELIIRADGETYTVTYEPGIVTLATGEGDNDGVVFGDVNSITREADAATDGGEPVDAEGLTYPRQVLCPKCDRQANASTTTETLPLADGDGTATVEFEDVTCPTCHYAKAHVPDELPTAIHGQDLKRDWTPAEGATVRVIYNANRGGEKSVTLTVTRVQGGSAGIVHGESDDGGREYTINRSEGWLSRKSDSGSWSNVGDVMLAAEISSPDADSEPASDDDSHGGRDSEGEDGVAIPDLSVDDDVRLGIWTLPTAGGEPDQHINATVTDVDHITAGVDNGEAYPGRVTLDADGEVYTLGYNPFDVRIADGDPEDFTADAFGVVISAERLETDGGVPPLTEYELTEDAHTYNTLRSIAADHDVDTGANPSKSDVLDALRDARDQLETNTDGGDSGEDEPPETFPVENLRNRMDTVTEGDTITVAYYSRRASREITVTGDVQNLKREATAVWWVELYDPEEDRTLRIQDAGDVETIGCEGSTQTIGPVLNFKRDGVNEPELMADGGHRPGDEPWERVALRVLERNGWTGSSYVGGIIMAELAMGRELHDDVEMSTYERAVTYALAVEFREESSKRDPAAREFIAWLESRLDEPEVRTDGGTEATAREPVVSIPLTVHPLGDGYAFSAILRDAEFRDRRHTDMNGSQRTDAASPYGKPVVDYANSAACDRQPAEFVDELTADPEDGGGDDC